MSATSVIVDAALASVRATFLAAAAEIAPTANLLTVATDNKPLPMWKLILRSVATDEQGAPIVRLNITAEAIYKYKPVTAGADNEVEQEVQRLMLVLPMELRARPKLQSAAYASGCGYLAPEGIEVRGAQIAVGSDGATDTLDVVTDVTIPLELHLETS